MSGPRVVRVYFCATVVLSSPGSCDPLFSGWYKGYIQRRRLFIENISSPQGGSLSRSEQGLKPAPQAAHLSSAGVCKLFGVDTCLHISSLHNLEVTIHALYMDGCGTKKVFPHDFLFGRLTPVHYREIFHNPDQHVCPIIYRCTKKAHQQKATTLCQCTHISSLATHLLCCATQDQPSSASCFRNCICNAAR